MPRGGTPHKKPPAEPTRQSPLPKRPETKRGRARSSDLCVEPTAFVQSAQRHGELPDHHLPEIGLIGRSNVGKSSALNVLLRTKDLARVSKTPGRTQLLNLFRFENRIAFVDLPGYGYAKLSKRAKDRISVMVRDYLAERDALCGVLLLLDARRDGPSPDDLQVASWILDHKKPLLLTLTKIDQVPKNRRVHHQRRYERAFGVESGTSVTFSAVSGGGRAELLRHIESVARS